MLKKSLMVNPIEHKLEFLLDCTTMTKRTYFSSTGVSAMSWPAELFWVVKGLLHLGLPSDDGGEYSGTHCDQFAIYFVDKIACIHSNLVSGTVV